MSSFYRVLVMLIVVVTQRHSFHLKLGVDFFVLHQGNKIPKCLSGVSLYRSDCALTHLFKYNTTK